MEECLKLVTRYWDRAVCISFPLILLLAKTDLVSEKRRGKKDPGRPCNSSGSIIVLTLLTKVVAVHVRLPAVYVRGMGLQLLPGCLGNDESWSGSGSKNESRSGSKSSSLQNSLKNLLQVILGVLGDTSDSKGVSNGGFRPRGSSSLVGQFVT